jgi:hypothetical protein
MASDIAVFGELALPSGKAAKWKALDATPASRRDWKEFAGPCAFEGNVAEALDALERGPQGAWSWTFDVSSRRVAVAGVLPRDAFHDHGRLVAMLWLLAGEIGATGELAFRGFETSDAGWKVRLGAKAGVAPMTKAERRAADGTPAMKALVEAAEELVEDATESVAPAKLSKMSAAGPHPEASPEGVRPQQGKKGGDAAALAKAPGTGKPKERAAALLQLVEVEPSAAGRIALEWLTDDVLCEDRLYQLVDAATQVCGAIGSRPHLERLVALVVEGSGVGVTEALATTSSPDVADCLAAALTDDNFRDQVANTTEVLELLLQRREVGDRARIERLARDAAKIVAACDLPEMSKADWVKRITKTAKAVLKQGS